MCLRKLREIERTGNPVLPVPRSQRVGHDWVTEQQQELQRNTMHDRQHVLSFGCKLKAMEKVW